MSQNPNQSLHLNQPELVSLSLSQQLSESLHHHNHHPLQKIQPESEQDVPHPPDQQIDYFHPQAAESTLVPKTPLHHQSQPQPQPQLQPQEQEQELSFVIPTTGKQRLPRKYFCKTCNQGFTRKHNMVSHELIHSSLKPHVCNICHLKFRRIHDLKRHEKLHTGEKPYSCEKCSRRFARPDALTRHQNSANACLGSTNNINNAANTINNSVNNIHNGFTNGETSSGSSCSQDMSFNSRPLNHMRSGGSVGSSDDTPQRPALAVNQQDERDSSATSNSTGVSSHFSSNSNEPATSGDSTTTHDMNCIPTLKTIGLSPEDLERKQNIRSHSNQEFGSKHQQMMEKQPRSQSFDNKAYSAFNRYISSNSLKTTSGSAFTPNPIYPLTFYPFPQFNNSNNNTNNNGNQNSHISLPPLSVPHQPQSQTSFVPQMTPHHPPVNAQHGSLPVITGGGTTVYGDESQQIQRSDLSNVSTLVLSKSSPGLQGLNPIPTPVKFPPNPATILRSNSINNSFMIPSLGGRPQSLPTNAGHQTHSQKFSNQGNTPSAPASNTSQIGQSTWGPPQNRRAMITSLPPPSQMLNPSGSNSATKPGQIRNIPQPSEIRHESSLTSTSASDDYFKPKPHE